MDPTAAAEGFSRLTWEIEGPGQDGVCRLTVTHELAGMPSLYAMTSGNNEFGAMGGGGWPWILSDLKTPARDRRGLPQGLSPPSALDRPRVRPTPSTVAGGPRLIRST